MSRWNYEKGLHDLGNGIYAYLQPDGSWGLSNARLIINGDQSLLVDTLFDEKITDDMLDIMYDVTGQSAGDINTLVNTHAIGDHTYGNRLVSQAEIIASKAGAQEAAFDIALGDYESWGDAERIAVNVDTLYREYNGDTSAPNMMQLFPLMAAMSKR